MIEINGTYYAKDTIKAIERVVLKNFSPKYEFGIKILIGVHITNEYLLFEDIDEAEQSRKQLVDKLTLKQKQQ